MKKYVLSFGIFAIMMFALCINANAAQIVSDNVSDGTRCVVLAPDGSEDDGYVIRQVINQSEDEALKITLTKGDYHLTSTVALFSNTTIEATGANVYQQTPGKGIFINARRLDGVYSGVGGYGSIKNVKIKGGSYICKASPDTSKTLKSNGYYVGYSTFLFMHGENITVDSCSFKNNYNGHFVEFAGVKNGKVLNCNMNVKSSKYVGENSNEAIQIDNTYAKANSPVGAPWDDTPCKNITIKNCKIKFARGIGTNRIGNSFFENITIEKCNITSNCEGINIYDTLGLKINKCTVRTLGKKNNYTSSAIYIGLDSKVPKSKKKKCTVKITGNTAYGLHAGLKINSKSNSNKFTSVEIRNNKLYSSKSKSYALRLSYNGKQISKLVKKNNTIKKKG